MSFLSHWKVSVIGSVLLLCVSLARSQELPDDPRKVLHDISVRLYEKKQNEVDYQVLQNLYQAASEGTNKRTVLALAAEYQRRVLKNPARTLETLWPHLIAKDAFDAWKKANQKTLRAISSGNGTSANLTELPNADEWNVSGTRGILAIEAAHALFALGKNDGAFRIIDAVGRENNDDVRVLAAECAADLCAANEDYGKANEYFKYASETLRRLQSRDHHYEQGDRTFEDDERAFISKRLKEKTGKVSGRNGSGIAALPPLDVKSWPNAAPKVDRLDIKAQFIICMIPDNEGGAFVGTEDHGVYHYSSDGQVKQYKDELADPNCYALCIDKQGRLWSGNLNSGVSVFNGETWKNYDVVDGPIGERIYDIQCCPVDGDVWVATSAGLTRYRTETDTWEHFTREDGLLEDQASSLAFKKDGSLIVGTQCHGISIFKRNRNGEYLHDKNITAPERFGPGNCSPVPLTPNGNGLPTNQINQILVAQDETVWIATPTGLVKADKNVTKLQYVRGKNYADKVRGLYGGAPKSWKECDAEIMEQLLPEDYVTCLAEDENGTIWIGTRQKGFMGICHAGESGGRNSNSNVVTTIIGDRASMGMADNYVSSILPMADGMPLIALYIGGVIKPKSLPGHFDHFVPSASSVDAGLANSRNKNSQNAEKSSAKRIFATKKNVVKTVSVAQQNFPKLPSPIKPPTVEELKALQMKLQKLNRPLPKIFAQYYGEDWKTQGDWVGRYGQTYAILCAMNAPYDRKMYHHQDEVQVNHFIGPNTPHYDGVRHWVHWLKTDNSRTLYDPFTGGRRQAEWDDHGEVYPMSKDGPDVWYIVQFKKKGVYRLSMYFMNKDGHEGMNRMRDYMVKVYPFPKPWMSFEQWPYYSREAERQTRLKPPLAQSRVKDFWGGEYKTFVVNGPGVYAVKIDDNYSYNTIISSVMVDRMVGEENPTDKMPIPWVYVQYQEPRLPKSWELRTEIGDATLALWKTIKEKHGKLNAIHVEKEAEIFSLRSVLNFSETGTKAGDGYFSRGEEHLKNHIQWATKYWDENARQEFATKMSESWKIFCERNPRIVEMMNVPRKVPKEIYHTINGKKILIKP